MRSALQQRGGLAALAAHHPDPSSLHLMVGPWDHEGTAGTAERAACIPVPSTEQQRWDTYQAFFDRYLRGDDNGFGGRREGGWK